MRMRWILGVLLGLAWAGPADAHPPAGAGYGWCDWWGGTSACPSLGCCPNDYVKKPLPCVCPLPCGGPDDYCRKPLPCVPAVPRCGGPDDYCRKPLPCLVCPPQSPHLQCGPAAGPGSPCGKH